MIAPLLAEDPDHRFLLLVLEASDLRPGEPLDLVGDDVLAVDVDVLREFVEAPVLRPDHLLRSLDVARERVPDRGLDLGGHTMLRQPGGRRAKPVALGLELDVVWLLRREHEHGAQVLLGDDGVVEPSGERHGLVQPTQLGDLGLDACDRQQAGDPGREQDRDEEKEGSEELGGERRPDPGDPLSQWAECRVSHGVLQGSPRVEAASSPFGQSHLGQRGQRQGKRLCRPWFRWAPGGHAPGTPRRGRITADDAERTPDDLSDVPGVASRRVPRSRPAISNT